jgi:murein DD-endopeptidase MepM/ murein hydrolase activator NlpD
VTSAETRVFRLQGRHLAFPPNCAAARTPSKRWSARCRRTSWPAKPVSDSSSEAAKTIDKVSAVFPKPPHARLEARQLAFVEGLTRLADRRAPRKPNWRSARSGSIPPICCPRWTTRARWSGPFIAFTSSTDPALDQRFQRLAVSLARLSALQRGLTSMPQVMPADLAGISSGFGYRSDPFNGSAAFHAGLDFKGPIGSPIHAAAQGKVSFVGQRQGYGNCVEVDHGNGMVTRYAHMSAFRTTLGKDVLAGEVIGAIGNTGRSTGPHLHFEVRINDQPSTRARSSKDRPVFKNKLSAHRHKE